MSKLRNISGFPEWLPQEKLVEDRLISLIKAVYQSHGFVPIETPAIELMSTLAKKGVIEQEIFSVRRSKDESNDEAELGLHFDLTVPFARYTAQHLNDLVFPFRRYQLQKVWRGERPQKGRAREFYQFDIDIIARETLPASCDAEVVTVMAKAFEAIGLGNFEIRLNNRKLFWGYFESLGLSAEIITEALVIIDKLGKIGEAGVTSELSTSLKISSEIIDKMLLLIRERTDLKGLDAVIAQIPCSNALFQAGCEEVRGLRPLLTEGVQRRVLVDFSLARGLNYYTGLIIEVRMSDFPNFPSVGGGGRYADLASQFTTQALPGVGASIGLTRLMDLAISEKLLRFDRKTSTQVIIAVNDEQQRPKCNEVAEQFRACGVATEVFVSSPKIGKQIDYAAKLGVQYVVFVQPDGSLEAKDVVSGEQQKVGDVAGWCGELKV